MADIPQKLDVLITLHDDPGQDMTGLSDRLSAQGLENAVNLASIGMISGAVAPDKLAQLRAEPGVKAVEVAGGVQIAPPDADIQ